jgi:CRISPR-associated protein Csx14
MVEAKFISSKPDIGPITRSATLLATLGGQPQVVTFALDALLARGVDVTEVFVLYLRGEADAEARVGESLARLTAEFTGDSYAGRPMAFRVRPLQAGDRFLPDIYDETDADGVWRAVHKLMAELKAGGRTLHICISGGRRLLGLMTMSAAMLHFGHQDVLWHMYTPPDITAEAEGGVLMHLPPDSGFRLIRVPMMPWGSYFPALQELARPALGEDVLARPRHVLDAVERARCAVVVERLTPRQREVLRLLASGETPQATAARLGLRLSTIDSHKTAILAECRNAWNLPEDIRLDYRFVWEKFENYQTGL